MAKKSIVTETKDAVVDATRSGAQGVKSVASEAVGAAAAAATSVVLDRISIALDTGAKKVKTVKPTATKAVTRAVAFSGLRNAPAKARKKAVPKLQPSTRKSTSKKKRRPTKKKARGKK
jgi:hypothetical protein